MLPTRSAFARHVAAGDFWWATGIEDTFITSPHPVTGRTLDEYELTEHYGRWRDDLRLMAQLGVPAARYGIPWHRIQPEPNRWDWRHADGPLEHMLDLGIAPQEHGDLEHWARQGVLLLNTSLTVEAGRAGSHAGCGWEAITDAVVAAVAARSEPGVFILWGSHARKKAQGVPELANNERHLILTSAHPSPLSAYAGFFGSKPFSRANAFLEANGRGAIDW